MIEGLNLRFELFNRKKKKLRSDKGEKIEYVLKKKKKKMK